MYAICSNLYDFRKLTAIARLIIWMCWHLRCTGTWGVSSRAVRLYSNDMGPLIKWSSWLVRLAPWLISIKGGASIKNSAVIYKWEHTIITACRRRKCRRLICSWPDCKKSIIGYTGIWPEPYTHNVCIANDGPWLINSSTMFGCKANHVQLDCVIWTCTLILNLEMKKGKIYSLFLINSKCPCLFKEIISNAN